MADIEALLRQHAYDILPTAAQRERAARSHNYLRDALQTGNMEWRIIDSYLSGSYARHTALRPLRDVDIVVEIDPSYWRRGPFDRLLGRLPKPAAILTTFATATRLRYQQYGSPVCKQRRSVRLVLEHLDLDIVPAVLDEERPDWYWIPDVEQGEWLSTAPKIHSDIASSLNEEHERRFIPLVRLLKAWNSCLPSTARIKSFAVETLAARLFQKEALASFTEGMHAFFDFVAWLGNERHVRSWRDSLDVQLRGWTPRLPDLAKTGSNLFAKCTSEQLAKFAKAAEVMRREIEAADASRSEASAWSRIEPRLRLG